MTTLPGPSAIISIFNLCHRVLTGIQHLFSKNGGFTLFTFQHRLDMLGGEEVLKFLNLRRQVDDWKK